MKRLRSLATSNARRAMIICAALFTLSITGQTAHAAPGDLYETDQGSMSILKFTPAGVQSTFASGGLRQPAWLAFDSAGNLYVSDSSSNIIFKYTLTGTQSTFGSGLNGPSGLAFDSAGNLYEADYWSNKIYIFSPGRTGFFTGNLYHPSGLAFDSAGNLYVSDGMTDSYHILKFTPSETQSIFASGLNGPNGLAFDNAGNLFESDLGSGTIFKFTPSGTKSTFASGLNRPIGLAFDRSGNLYEADQGSGTIFKFTPGGTRSVFVSGLNGPSGLAFEVTPVPPQITAQPQDQTVTATKSVTFTVSANGTTPLNYQWWRNSNIISGATGSSLMINNVQLANAGNYTVVVSNTYGSVTSAPAKLTVISTPTAAVATPPYPAAVTTAGGKDSLVFITHGLTPTPGAEDWIDQMASSIAGKVPSNWTVMAYRWTDLSSILIPYPTEPDFVHGASRAAAVGNKVGWELINNALSNAPNKKWAHIHFIAHSAGSALIEEAAAIVKLYSLNHSWNTDIQITFLDPYTGFYDEWRNVYGIDAAWADDYFCIDTTTFDPTLGPFGRTDGPLANAYSVDVTARDPAVTSMPLWCPNGSAGTIACRSQPYSTHGWPHSWYQRTVDHNNPRDSQYDPSGYGFPLSKEAGGAGGGNFSAYPPNATPVVLGGSQTIIQGPINLGSGLLVSYNSIPNAVSPTGTVQTTNSGFNATGGTIHTVAVPRWKMSTTRPNSTSATGDPVWISVPIDTQTNINYIACDLTFTSQTGSAGLVTVYWNEQQIGFIDEQYAIPGTRTYTFGVSDAFLDKNNCLAFRLDEFSNVTSSISVANVKTGFAGLQTPILSIAKNQSGNQIMSLTGTQGYTFLIQASTDLLNWTPISNASLTGGTTAQFSDPDASKFAKRFYRALSP